MKHYVLATQREWGVKVFERVRTGRGDWRLVQTKEEMCWPLQAPRYLFCVGWSIYVPTDILAMSEPINFHAFGPGPIWHRGGGPIEHLLLRGYTETMIWAHRMTPELDAGPVYGARGPVSLAGTKVQILERFIAPVVDLIRWMVAEEPEPYPQVGEIVTFKRLPKAEMEALWSSRHGQ